MAGHSKWANIKRQKARVDAKKGAVFARLSRAIIVAARHGSADPAGNFQLRTAIEKAKAAGIPNQNIERAIAKGSGQLGPGNDWEDVRYEGYGPGGVAILIEAMTDNRNRTAADLRSAFSKQDGNLGETGCVGWMFESKGVLTVQGPLPSEEDFLEVLLEVGAQAYELLNDDHTQTQLAEVSTDAQDLESVTQQLQTQGYNIRDPELRWCPTSTVTIDDPEQARKVLKLMDTLEDLDDVQSVTANFDVPDDLMTALSH